MEDKKDAESKPSCFGAFIPIEQSSDSDNSEEEEDVETCSGEGSFKGDCNDEEDYGDQNDLFDVIASTVGRTSDRPELYDNINKSDLLPEDFLTNAFLKAVEDTVENNATSSKRTKLA